jgi:CRP/FNR family transcriptional regulator
MADAVTETDCDLISLEREDFLSFLAHSHSASLAVMSSLAEIVRSAGASLEGFGTLDAQGRLASLLLRYSEIHGTDIGTGRGNVEIKVTQQTLANHIGASRETVARLLKSMADIGAIKKDRIAIVVVDKDKLQDLVARQTSA